MIPRLALCLVILTAPALADPTADEAAARFDRGVKFYEQGDNLSALAEFQEAYKLTGQWEILFNIGVTEKKLFRYGEAIHTFAKYLTDGGTQIPAGRRAEVERAQVEIHASVAELTVTVTGAPAEITVDRLAAGTSPLVEALLVGPGHHEIAAHRTGETDAKSIEVVSGQHATIALDPKPEVPKTARLTIATAPTGGALVIDHQPSVTAPWTAVVPAGIHDVTATMLGRIAVTKELQVIGGQDLDVRIDLVRVPEPTPIYKRWYVIAGAAVIVVGGAIAIYEATRVRTDVVIDYP